MAHWTVDIGRLQDELPKPSLLLGSRALCQQCRELPSMKCKCPRRAGTLKIATSDWATSKSCCRSAHQTLATVTRAYTALTAVAAATSSSWTLASTTSTHETATEADCSTRSATASRWSTLYSRVATAASWDSRTDTCFLTQGLEERRLL
nr:unnamed protein product [Digitaria exilis]